MKAQESYNIWLENAYCLFAEEGPHNLTIQSLAKKCGLPRTNFYYYFDSKEDLLNKVIDLHFNATTELFNAELLTRFYSFIPDLYLILYDFKQGLQFAKNLFKHRDIPQFNEAYKKGIALSADLIVPKFTTYFDIDLSHKQAKEFWYSVTDTWYSRLNFNNFSVDYLIALCHEVMNTMVPLIEKGNILHANTDNHSFSTPLSK